METVRVRIDIETVGEHCCLSTDDIASYWERIVRSAVGSDTIGAKAPQIVVQVSRESE